MMFFKSQFFSKHAHNWPFIALVMAMIACAKEKKSLVPQRKTNLESQRSSIGILNLADAFLIHDYYDAVTNAGLDLTVNDIALTNYLSYDDPRLGNQPFPPNAFFPHSKLPPNPATFYIPTSLLDRNGDAHIKIVFVGTSGFVTNIADTIIHDDPAHPKVYVVVNYPNTYEIPSNLNSVYYLASYKLVPINSTPVAANAPEKFKLRIVNFSSSQDVSGLSGPVTLTFADGGLVDPKLAGVSPGTPSDYAEIPFGSYQFKLFSQNFKQLPEPSGYLYIDLASNTVQGAGIKYASLREFGPGGVYSIYIYRRNAFFWPDPVNGGITPIGFALTSYAYSVEQAPSSVAPFIHIQFVNALYGKQCRAVIDDTPTGSLIGFGGHTAYSIFGAGSHTVSIQDSVGNVLASETITTGNKDQLTVWGYLLNGAPSILVTNTDLSITPFDATVFSPYYGPTSLHHPLSAKQVRFLNLSTDVPYVTFGSQSGLFGNSIDPMGAIDAAQNLKPGLPSIISPYIYLPPVFDLSYYDRNDFHAPQFPPYASGGEIINAYASKPGYPPVVPGGLLDIQALNNTDFVANPDIYTNDPYPISGELGAYTVALIGSQSQHTLKLQVIKHNN